MSSLTLDPYEQQLLSVFDSYDHDSLGSLDRAGLTALCQTLQLEEQGTDLIQRLLKAPQARATFSEFKDALLTLLGNMQRGKSDAPTITIEDTSPEREVSPKFVYGSKKYGRRSRPKIDEHSNENDENYLNKSPISVQRSNSQTEVSSKKRKTNYKLKRCTSLPGGQRISEPPAELLCTEEMLRNAWHRLGVGEDGFLNQSELGLVCDAIGLHKLANGVIRQLSAKLTLDFNHRISFQELFEALQEDETWVEVLSTTAGTQSLTNNISQSHDLFPDSATFQYVALGPEGNGTINADTLIDMWESVGITAPKELIHELGFNSREINICELASMLDKELKVAPQESGNPHMTLLQANLTLYQSEIRALKTILEQLHAEREKLKCDVSEANNRAKLLAQEVDDNHVRMEQSTLNQVKQLEQRHLDLLRELTLQHASDKEGLSTMHYGLERKIASLELEVGKLKSDLGVAQKYSASVETENRGLNQRIAELQHVKEVLTEQIGCLESEKSKYVEMEHEQLEPLLSKLSVLQLENSQLRDKNDEMCVEIEGLVGQVAGLRCKVAGTPTYRSLDQSMEDGVCEGVGLGAKRRSDYSPSKDVVLFGIADGSPHLGKVRKFQEPPGPQQPVDVQPFTSNESGFEAEVGDDSFDTSSIDDTKEITRLQAKIAFLEQILAQHSIPVPEDKDPAPTESLSALKARVLHLESHFKDLSDLGKMINKNGLNSDTLKQVGERLEKIINSESKQQAVEESCKEFEDENESLRTKCSELESCVELLRTEYERCEDYWQCKLEEERQMFEQEQSQSNEKLTDLITKMSEYEEQYGQDASDGRLPTIEETYNLEKQFTDLEQEFEDYKVQSENEIFQKDEEIAVLKDKLTQLALQHQRDSEDKKISNKMNNLSLCVVETTNLFSADAMPVSWPPAPKSEDLNTTFVWNKEETLSPATSLSWQNSATSSSEKSSAPCRPKRTRKHERNTCLYKKTQEGKKIEDAFKRQEQVVALPISTVHGLNARLHHLEQRCRQLQMVLKQQHFYTEQALQQNRQHHRGEKMELQCLLRGHQERLDQQVRLCNDQLDRLARTDMLVKELYVENSYLIAKVQRLEQQCHILAQCSAASSV